MNNIKVATVQFQHHQGDLEANFAILESFVEQAAEEGVELIVFPECCLSGYWHLRNLSQQELTLLAEKIPAGQSTQRMLALSAKHKMTIGAGLVELDENGDLYNSYIATMPNGTCKCHRKLHCFISEYMKSGDQITVFDIPDGPRVGVLICYDNNIIENARLTALAGAEILLAPHQTGGTKSGSPQGMKPIDVALWENRRQDPDSIQQAFKGPNGREWLLRWLPSRAHDNGMFLIFSNGVGRDDNEVRTGNAMILDPYGRIISETWKAENTMVIAELDASLRDRCTGERWMKSRRPELYTPIATPTGNERDTRAVRFEHDNQ